jgi:hypothetical protein
MKEMNDEELQQWFDDVLFASLKKEPERGLPYDFSARVMQQVKADVKKRNDLKWDVLALFIFAVIAAGIYGFMLTFSPKALPSLLAYKWIFLMVPFVFIVIQAIDQKLVKSNIYGKFG